MINVRKIDTFSGHRNSIYTLEVAHEPNLFFSAGGDGMVVMWDLTKPDWGKVVAQVPSSIYALAFDESKKQLWVGQNFEGIQVIDIENNAVVASSNFTKASIFDIKILDNQVFVALSDGVVAVLDKETLATKKHLKAADQSARCLAISPNKKHLAVGYSDHSIKIFDTQTYNLLQVLTSHTNSVFTVCYSPNGQFLLSGGRDAQIKIWDSQYQLHQSIPAHLFAINHIVFNHSGTMFASCSMDKSIKLWEAETFKLLKVIDKARHAGHGTSVNKLLWISETEQFVSCSDDTKISVWGL